MLTVRIKRQTLAGETPVALSHAVRAFIEAHGYGYREIGGRWPVTGLEARTGRVLVTMVGDDHRFAVEEDDLTRLGELDYCGECGQVGCGHDGRDRSAGA